VELGALSGGGERLDAELLAPFLSGGLHNAPFLGSAELLTFS
jgi:hypothetical protein